MTASPPPFSVVVPTHDRPEQLRRCLAALAGQDYPRDAFEVIVVDDGGARPAAPVAEPFRERLALTVLRQQNAGPGPARNAGAARARYPFYAFTDDDCVPVPGWLRALARAAEGDPGALLGGGVANALPENPFSTASQLLSDYLYEHYSPESGRRPFFASINIAMHAERFHAIGGFDPAFPRIAEDRNFCARWHRAGHLFRYVPDAVVYHAHDLSAMSYWRQHFSYGRGGYHYHRQRQASGEMNSLKPEPLAFYANLVRHPLRSDSGVRAWLHAALLAVSQVATVGGYAFEALCAYSSRSGRARGFLTSDLCVTPGPVRTPTRLNPEIPIRKAEPQNETSLS